MTTAFRDIHWRMAMFLIPELALNQPLFYALVALMEVLQYSLNGFADASAARTVSNGTSNGAGVNNDTGALAFVISAAGSWRSAISVSFDSDGFTLSYTKTGSPTGTVVLTFLQ